MYENGIKKVKIESIQTTIHLVQLKSKLNLRFVFSVILTSVVQYDPNREFVSVERVLVIELLARLTRITVNVFPVYIVWYVEEEKNDFKLNHI